MLNKIPQCVRLLIIYYVCVSLIGCTPAAYRHAEAYAKREPKYWVIEDVTFAAIQDQSYIRMCVKLRHFSEEIKTEVTFDINKVKNQLQNEKSTIVSYEEANSPVYQTNGFSVLTELVADLTPTDITGKTEPALPTAFKLLQNHPNPFNPETSIEYQLPHAAEVALSIYDIQGREIRRLAQGTYPAGFHKIMWDGRDYAGSIVASGIYFYKIEVKMLDTSYMDVKKMILMK